MKKRLMIGMATGAIVVAMLPGVASADPPGSRPPGGPTFVTSISCDIQGGSTVVLLVAAAAGWSQSVAHKSFQGFLKEFDWKCEPGTRAVTTTRVS